MNDVANINVEALSEPLTFSVEPYVSEDYALAEGDKLWPKVWQHAGRVEEAPRLPNPHQKQKVTNFHRNLAHYMGTGAPRRLKVHNDFGQ